jgi:hypothetical protein
MADRDELRGNLLAAAGARPRHGQRAQGRELSELPGGTHRQGAVRVRAPPVRPPLPQTGPSPRQYEMARQGPGAIGAPDAHRRRPLIRQTPRQRELPALLSLLDQATGEPPLAGQPGRPQPGGIDAPAHRVNNP